MTENGQPAADIQTEQSTPHEAEELTSTSVTVPVIIKDFGFLPIPRRLRREDSSKAIGFGLVLNVGFGIASTFSEFRFASILSKAGTEQIYSCGELVLLSAFARLDFLCRLNCKLI